MTANGFCVFDTEIGPCGLAWGDRGVVGVQLPQANAEGTRARMRQRFALTQEIKPPSPIEAVLTRIAALLAGHPDPLLDVVLDMTHVTDFHQRVYAIARAIPPGRTLTYGEVAQQLGDAGAARAVGQALGHNPFAPVVPCHRVLAARNEGGGFSADGGVATKLRMLQIEKAQLGPERGLFD